MAEISWYLVFGFAATGIGMGVLSCRVGMRPKVENPLWWLLYLIWIAIALILDSKSPFWTLLIASVLAGLFHGGISAFLIDQYKQNNPWHAKKMKGSKSKQQRSFIKIGLTVGFAFGLMVAGIGWGLSKLL